jgi:glycine/D-amino acid oxidase-like deaminating enzyme
MPNSLHFSRRTVLAGIAAAAGASTVKSLAAEREQGGSAVQAGRRDVIVVGAGVFGAWTAKRLQDAGKRVLLVDAWGPAHARASSGGESRLTRGSYGSDEVYTRMALDSLPEWRSLSDRAGLPIFHEVGILFFFPQVEPYLEETMRVHRRLSLPTELLDNAALRSRFPQMNFEGIAAGIYERQFGALMARRAVQTLVDQFVRAGGLYRTAAVLPPAEGPTLDAVQTTEGETLAAERFVFACGPWLGRVFPGLLGSRIFPTRQEVFFFAPEPGDTRFEPGRLPGWADFNNGDIYYGFPDLEGRGFKIAHDAHGPRMDPDVGDRTPSAEALADVRNYMVRRFPALAGRPLSEARVCQYENSSNGDLLIDLHPRWGNVLLVGAGSGHGFKHGPAVGRYAADRLLGTLGQVEPRFSLASKGEVENRAVH